MKKSRIIIPALAMIAFSVAASITGAVAWFTASRTAQIDAGTYAVVKTSANLDVELIDGAHTETNGTDTVEVKGVLTDGSFDHVNKKVYTPAADGKSLKVDNQNVPVAISVAGDTYTDSGDELLRGATAANTSVTPNIPSKNIYTAVTFDITFTVSFGAVSGDIGLYLDNTSGKSNVAVSPTAAAKTAQGFRMAFVPIGTNASSGNTRVWADLQQENETYPAPTTENPNATAQRRAISYIGGEAPATAFSNGGLEYGTNVLIDADYEAALPTSATARSTATARPDCLGVFTFNAGSQVTLSYRVVCWFEGTDPEIVNRDVASEYQSVIATLNFEAVDLAAA